MPSPLAAAPQWNACSQRCLCLPASPLPTEPCCIRMPAACLPLLLWLDACVVQLAGEGRKVHVVVPDLGEYSRSSKL